MLLGGTFIERDQEYGYLEAALLSRFPGQKIVVRNLGWSGDTVWCDSRAGFGSAADGFRRLVELVSQLKPTVILIAYGNNEAFAGPAGLDAFAAGMKSLLDALAPTGARVVLFSPLEHENLGPPFADPTAYNGNVKLYSDAIARIAAERGLRFCDILRTLSRGDTSPALRLTDNGMHLTASGYWRAAPKILAALGLPEAPWLVDIDGTKVLTTSRTKVTGVEQTATGVKFRVTDEWVPQPPAPAGTSELVLTNRAGQHTLRIRGLTARYQLRIDGKRIDAFDAEEWSQGIVGIDPPETDQSERLRRQIVAKNELCLHRFRPQNETYLFGFRQSEQGKNAIELPKFDPIIASKDERISQLTVPVAHVYELIEQ